MLQRLFPLMTNKRDHIVVGDINQNDNGELRISLRLAVLLQLVMMAAGAGATYTATRAAIDSDKQKIEEQSKSILLLQATMINTQQSVAGLTTAIDYLTKEVQSMQERLWNTNINDRNRH
jgi:uncharacterized protein YlxW (UPF0749 family)